MRKTLVFAIVALVSGLMGCQTELLSSDGVRCDVQPLASDRVSIEIRYADDGRPSAVPENCTVPPRTRITWRGPADDDAPYVLMFPGGSPGADGGRGELPSRSIDGRQKVELVTGDTEGTYKYSISANGIEVDPAIIIKR